MQVRLVDRGKQRLAVLWSLCLLLQQFHVVLLQESGIWITSGGFYNDDEDYYEYEEVGYSGMKTDLSYNNVTPAPDDAGRENSTECTSTLLQNITCDVATVLKEQYNNSVVKILAWMPSCSSSGVEDLKTFWESYTLFKPFYHLLSALLFSVVGCPGEVAERLKEAEEELGCELMEEALHFILDILDDNDNTGQPDSTNGMDDVSTSTHAGSCTPSAAHTNDDPNEQDKLEIKMSILQKNIMNLGEFNNLVQAYSLATIESEKEEVKKALIQFTNSMKESVAEEQHFMMFSIHCDDPENTDKDVQNSTFIPEKSLNISHIRTRRAIIHYPTQLSKEISHEKVKSNMAQHLAYNKSISRHKREAKYYPSKVPSTKGDHHINSQQVHNDQVSIGPFRFLLKVAGGCGLLTSESNGSFSVREDYSAKLLESQTWVLKNSTTLWNRDTNATVSIISIQCKTSWILNSPSSHRGDSFPSTCLSGDNNFLALPTKNCRITLSTASTPDLPWSNSTSVQMWELFPLVLEKGYIKEVVLPNIIKTESVSSGLLATAAVHAASFDDESDGINNLLFVIQVHLLHHYSHIMLQAAEGTRQECVAHNPLLGHESRDQSQRKSNHSLLDSSEEDFGNNSLFDPTTNQDVNPLIYRRLNPQARNLTINTTSPIYFLKMSGKCKLLTSENGSSLPQVEEYSDDHMRKQLWEWNTGPVLLNKHTNASVSIRSIQCETSHFHFPVSSSSSGSSPTSCVSDYGRLLALPTKDCVVVLEQESISGQISESDPFWQLIPFSEDEKHFQDVVCPFFMILDSFPCRLLTDNEGYEVIAEAYDLDYPETQLWFWSKGRIINFFSGLALEAASNATSYITLEPPRDSDDTQIKNQQWEMKGTVLQSALGQDLHLHVPQEDGNFHVQMSNTSGAAWSLLDALKKENQIEVTGCVQMYFVKVEALPCHLLTVQAAETEPLMKFYDSSIVLQQLWFIRGGRLINVENNLALGFQAVKDNKPIQAQVQSLDEFPDMQTWNIDRFITSRWEPACQLIVDVIDYRVQVDCGSDIEMKSYDQWELIPFGKGLTNMDRIQCHYFIKSDHPSCEVLTGYDSGILHLRPVNEHTFLEQMWHWDGQYLINTASGLYLTHSNGSKMQEVLNLSSLKLSDKQSWTSRDGLIYPVSQNSSVVTVEEETGFVYLRNVTDQTFQGWQFIESHLAAKHTDLLNCNPHNRSYFFIKNVHTPCLLLTGTSEGESIEFKRYDSNAAQLWYWDLADTLVNLHSGLALHLTDAGDVVMSIMSAFEKRQRWKLDEGVLSSSLNKSCNVVKDPEMTLSCSKSHEPQWQFIDASNVGENSDDIVCFYFIQNQHLPCEVLTADPVSKTVKLRPVTDELVDSQLWYWDGDHLIHTMTGLKLGLSPDNNLHGAVTLLDAGSNNTWIYHDMQITSQNGILTFDFNNDGVVMLSPNLSPKNPTHMWKLINKELLKQDPLTDSQILHCEAQKVQNMYFIKNSDSPCQLLTATTKGESPIFQVFDDSLINLQLWYKDGPHIINVGTNLAIHLELHNDSLPSVILWDIYAFAWQQKWKEEDSILSNSEGKCVLIMDNDRVTCGKGEGANKQRWEYIDFKETSSSLEKVVCLYFIRNQHESCEYLTGYSEGNPILLRPLMEDLLENQLWYWNGQHITNMKTGLVLDQEVSDYVTLLPRVEQNATQLWMYRDAHVSPASEPGLFLDVNVDDDGRIEVSRRTRKITQQWTFVEMNKAGENTDLLSCAVLPKDPVTFFLKSQARPCELLSALQGGQHVGFQTFDEDLLGNLLWFWHDSHLVNVGTGLALQQGEPAGLWPMAAFANKQKWQENKNQILCLNKQNCNLVTSAQGEATTETFKFTNNKLTLWKKVIFDETMNNLESIVCSYYIKNNLQPCELLTAFDKGEAVKLRPLDFALPQLWYWNGPYLVNKHSHLVLHTSMNDNTVRLSEKLPNWYRQKWEMAHEEKEYIRSIRTSLVLDLSGSTVVLSSKSDISSQRWTLVSEEKGLNSTKLLNCATNRTNITPFVMKNEQDPCHLVTQMECGRVELHEFSGEHSHLQQWFQEGRHIVNTVNDLVLSAKDLDNKKIGYVSLQMKFSYESFQMWQKDGDVVHSYLRDKTLVLASSGQDLVLQIPQGLKTEQWTWYNYTDVIQDQNLVARCSRCYDKKEEKAALVIGFIPFLSTIYNLVRSTVYAGKGCKEVALESLKDATIDVFLDIGIAAITIVTSGVGTSAALALKESSKLGFKAGAKAFAMALKATSKVGLNSIKIGVKAVLKQSVKQGIKNAGKYVIKGSVKSIKNTVKSLKHLTFTTAKGIKTLSTKSYHLGSEMVKRLRKVSMKQTFKSSQQMFTKTKVKRVTAELGRKFKAKSKTLGRKFKAMRDELASKAEHKIKQLDEINAQKSKQVVRCKRMPTSCNPGKRMLPEDIENSYRQIDEETIMRFSKEVLTGDQNVKAVFKDMAAEIRNMNINPKRQHAYLFSKRDGHPQFIDFVEITNRKRIHTEKSIIKKLDNNNLPFNPQTDDLYLYTMLSPCQSPPTSSCTITILDMCKRFFEHTMRRCYIGFEKYYGFRNLGNADDLVNRNIVLKNLFDLKTAGMLAGEQLNNYREFSRYASFVFLG